MGLSRIQDPGRRTDQNQGGGFGPESRLPDRHDLYERAQPGRARREQKRCAVCSLKLWVMSSQAERQVLFTVRQCIAFGSKAFVVSIERNERGHVRPGFFNTKCSVVRPYHEGS